MGLYQALPSSGNDTTQLGQLALRQVGKVGPTIPSHVQVFDPPGQLALWQVGEAGKPLT